MHQSFRVVAVSPWYILGYVNSARNARGFKEVLDYSVGSSPSVLFLKARAVFICTLLVSFSLQLHSLPLCGAIFKGSCLLVLEDLQQNIA